MKKNYHIKIEENERKHLEDILKTLNIFSTTTVVDTYNGIKIINYFVSLSKYDLLYIRLACKVGKIVCVDDWNVTQKQHDMSSDICQSPF
jgi:hypothetical protein